MAYSMSYKHNNLWAMRERYWNDQNDTVNSEKLYFQRILEELDVFPEAHVDDAKSLFFSLPSIIIVKGYALGFQHPIVHNLIVKHIQQHKIALQQRNHVKIQYKM